MMTKDQFLTQAAALLQRDPMTRVSPKTKAAMEHPQGCIFDTHCHIFDRGCIDENYFILRFLKESLGLEAVSTDETQPFSKATLLEKGLVALTQSEAEVYDKIEAGGQYDWATIEKEIEQATADNQGGLEGFSFGGLMRTMTNIVFKGSMREILDYYLNNVALRNLPLYQQRQQVTSILLMDLEVGWNRPVSKKLSQQIEEVKALMDNYAILPYLAVDPRRADYHQEDNLYRLFLQAFSGPKPFFGIKVYPALGYLPSDHRLMPIFEICERFNIPVLTHCGGNIISTYQNPITVLDGDLPRVVGGSKREDLALELNDPKNWRPVLEAFPNLKLNLGHFGGDHIWEAYPAPDTQNRLTTILNLMRTYSYVFADFSFNIIDNSTYFGLKEVLRTEQITRTRTLFGTDFWVVMPSGNLKAAQEEFNIVFAPYMQRMMVDNPKRYLFAKTPVRSSGGVAV